MPKNIIPTQAPLESTINSAVRLGVLIRAKRTALGMRVSDCAALCGIGINTLSRIENGNPNTTVGSVFSVLKGLGITLHFDADIDDSDNKDGWV